MEILHHTAEVCRIVVYPVAAIRRLLFDISQEHDQLGWVFEFPAYVMIIFKVRDRIIVHGKDCVDQAVIGPDNVLPPLRGWSLEPGLAIHADD